MIDANGNDRLPIPSRVTVSVWVCRLNATGWHDPPEKLSGDMTLLSGIPLRDGVVRLFSGVSGGVVVTVGVHGGVIAFLDDECVCRLHLDHTIGDLGSALVASIETEALLRANSI